MTETPSRYVPETENWRQKHWLYQQYWGEERLSTTEIAEQTDVDRSTIGKKMAEFGIPLRVDHFNSENSVSPFIGFYGQSENAQITDESNFTREKIEDGPTPENLAWHFVSRNDAIVGERGQMKQ